MSDADSAGAGQADSVGGALHESGAGASAADVQTEPLLEQNRATTDEKLDGIAAQTRVDLGDESDERYEEVLGQRLTDSGIELTDDEVRSLVQRAAHGSGGSGV